MRRLTSQLLTITILLAYACLGIEPGGEAGQPPAIGRPAPDFRLKDLNGKLHELKDYRGKTTVIGFISARCPVSNAYQDRVRALAEEYNQKGVVFIGINSSSDEALDEIRSHAAASRFKFTILKDEGSVIADAYAAERTPTVYVVDAEGVLRYQGRIDNSQNPRMVRRGDLREALNQILAGKPVSVAETKAMGCLIKRSQNKPRPALAKVSQIAADEPEVGLLKPAGYAGLLKQSEGKILIVNFWATWCGPCVAEFPEFVAIDTKYRDRGLRVIGISADETAEIKTKVVPFLKQQKARYENFVQDVEDPQDMIDVVNKDWSGTLPATFVYGKAGKPIYTRFGIIDREELVAAIEKELKK